MPIVLLDAPGGTFWHGLERFIQEDLAPTGVISPGDFDRVQITDSVTEAAAVITGFWRNYDSLRWVGDLLVLRLRAEPTPDEIAQLNEQFASSLASGRIEACGPQPAELADKDRLELPRICLHLNQRTVGGLFRLIGAINRFGSAPQR